MTFDVVLIWEEVAWVAGTSVGDFVAQGQTIEKAIDALKYSINMYVKMGKFNEIYNDKTQTPFYKIDDALDLTTNLDENRKYKTTITLDVHT